jgi:hypothetical protein
VSALRRAVALVALIEHHEAVQRILRRRATRRGAATAGTRTALPASMGAWDFDDLDA